MPSTRRSPSAIASKAAVGSSTRSLPATGRSPASAAAR